eukprot:357428-Chlamydomonas_euryale.AAC.6
MPSVSLHAIGSLTPCHQSHCMPSVSLHAMRCEGVALHTCLLCRPFAPLRRPSAGDAVNGADAKDPGADGRDREGNDWSPVGRTRS